jgi:hypothetical protein
VRSSVELLESVKFVLSICANSTFSEACFFLENVPWSIHFPWEGPRIPKTRMHFAVCSEV